MIRHWEEFEGRPNRSRSDEPRVTINKKGMLLLNKVAFEALQEPQAVKLFFDPNNQSIGLKPSEPGRFNSFPVKQKDKYYNRTVAASPFCKHHGIRVERTMLFNEVEMDKDGVMTLELKKTTAIGRGSF